MASEKEDIEQLIKFIASYRHKAVVLREIHSKLAQNCRTMDLVFSGSTIFLVSLTAFLGFSGADNTGALVSFLLSLISISLPAVSNASLFPVIFNFCVFIVFFGSLLNLIFRWKENHTVHFQGVVKLTQFINWLDSTKILIKKFNPQIIKDISSRYESIIDVLPPNDDCDYIDAKKSLIDKSNVNVKPPFLMMGFLKRLPSNFFNFNPDIPIKGEVFFKDLIMSSELLMPLLESIRRTDGRLWLGGGAVRNYVWDTLTGRVTALGDIDVIYFDSNETTEEADKKLEKLLIEKSEASLRWSVKNQARMYKKNGEPDVADLHEAIFNWPETATAIIIRLDVLGNLRIIAPHGLDDLFSLTVRPTPYHKLNPVVYNHRLNHKKWSSHWPDLKVEISN